MSCDVSNLRLSVNSLTATSFYAVIGKMSLPFTLASVKVTVVIFCTAFARCIHIWFAINSTLVYVKSVKSFSPADTGSSLLAKPYLLRWDLVCSSLAWPLLCLEWARHLNCSVSLSLQGQPKTYFSIDTRMVLVLHFIPNIFCGINTGWFFFFFPRQHMRHNYISKFKCIFARNMID